MSELNRRLLLEALSYAYSLGVKAVKQLNSAKGFSKTALEDERMSLSRLLVQLDETPLTSDEHVEFFYLMGTFTEQQGQPPAH